MSLQLVLRQIAFFFFLKK